MTAYVRAANPIWYMVDLTGNALDDTYYAHFLQNVFPYLPQSVYRDAAGGTEWPGSVVQFQPSGTLPNNLFFNDDNTYRIEIRQGSTQADPLIWEVNGFIPASNGSGGDGNITITSDNQVTNPQFAFISFASPLTITTSGTYGIAPGWDLVVTGAGTSSTVQWINTIAGTNEIINNPPYSMRFNMNGWDSVQLVQRFSKNGSIWASNDSQVGAVTASVTAISNDGNPNLLSLLYKASSASSGTPIATANLNTGIYSVIAGAIIIPVSTNSTVSDDAYVDFIVSLPPNGDTSISNLQILGQDTAVTLNFEQETVARQEDHMFHFYNPKLQYKPIPSHLMGWDFPLNPSQFSGDTVAASAIGVNKSKYVWDQTIIFQSVDSAVGVTRGTAGELVLTAAIATKMALIQYLDQTKARKILNERISSHLSAKTNVTGGIAGTISLWYTTDVTLPNIAAATNNSLVLTLDANGKPDTFNGTWVEVPRILAQDATFTIEESATTNFNNYSFNDWDMEGVAAVNTATFFAIVIGTATVTVGKTIGFNSVSLCSGDIATIPSAKSKGEVLLECQQFYMKTFPQGTAPAAGATAAGAVAYNAQNAGVVANSIMWQFPVVMRVSNPNFTGYTPVGGGTGWYNATLSLNSGSTLFQQESDRGAVVYNAQVAGDNLQDKLVTHATADARLGIV